MAPDRDNRPGNRGRHEDPRTYRQEKQPRQSPTLLTFRPREAKGRHGFHFTAFLPAISNDTLKKISRQVRRWRLHLRIGQSLTDLARAINPLVRGWMQYYGAFYRSAMHTLLQRINAYLLRWIRKKYKRLQGYRKSQGRLATRHQPASTATRPLGMGPHARTNRMTRAE